MEETDDLRHKYSTDNFDEALFLFVTASVGVTLNAAVIACVIGRTSLRRMTSAFLVHACLLDLVKCLFCIPFGFSLLHDIPPSYCSALGGSYVVIVTASGFNIVAMVCCEAYRFSEHNVTGGGTADGRGSFSCVVFGIVMVYIGSVIIHLGPTIIGGDFNYNDLIGNCIFVYGTVKSYVVHAMWIIIMTIAMVGAVYYLVYFYRHVQSNSAHRLASLVRASVAISRGRISNGSAKSVARVVRDSLSRVRVLCLITALFIACWYPLYLLTICDPRFQQSTKFYKLLTFIAWSNAALNPLVLILFDRNINTLRVLGHCHLNKNSRNEASTSVVPASVQSTPSAPVSKKKRSSKNRKQLPNPDMVYLQRVGSRLGNERPSDLTSFTNCNGGTHCDASNRDLSLFELQTLVTCN